jgi:hypothetical protein
MRIGDYIYYIDKHGDTYPCEVVKVGAKKIKIDAGFKDKSFVKWVYAENCALQSEVE